MIPKDTLELIQKTAVLAAGTDVVEIHSEPDHVFFRRSHLVRNDS